MIEHKRVFPTSCVCPCLLPDNIALFHTCSTGPVPCRNGCWLVRKEDTLFDVVALRYPEQGTGAIEPTIALVPLVAAQRPWHPAFIAFAIWPDEYIGFHRRPCLVTTRKALRVSTTIACARSRQRSRSGRHWNRRRDGTAAQSQ